MADYKSGMFYGFAFIMGLKVAHITTVDKSLTAFLLNQLFSIRDSGYEVIGISSPGSRVSEIEEAGFRHIPVDMTRNIFTPFQDLKSLWKLYRVIRREQFTIVHTHTPKASFLGQIAAKLAGIPIIVRTVHGFYFHENTRPVSKRIFITLEKIAASCSDVILSQNREDIETAIQKNIAPPEKIKYLGNGIDIHRFDPGRFSSAEITNKRIENGLREGAPVVGFVGRLVAEKGLLELFSAARIIKRKVPNVHFVFIGAVDFEKNDAIRPEKAQEFGLIDFCHFIGWRNDMPDLYAMMDVFTLPSHREGFPRSPMEASAMKIPCVVTDIRGCREVVEHGRNGFLVPLGDVQALADSIINILTNEEVSYQMGESGRRIALNRFDEQLVFNKVKAEYTRLLEEKDLLVPDPEPNC